MSDEQPRTHLDLFSGIGGFAIAAGWAGYSTRVFCEQDKYCTKVLNRHWPDVPVIRDIREFDGSKWRGAGLLTGGFPCQPWSQSGQQRGEEDDRALWGEMFRVIKEARPDFVLAENVAGLINMALDDVLSQLEGEGYTTGAVVLPACSLNAPHRRDRVWIMAHAKHKERQEARPIGGREKEKRNPSADAFTGCSGSSKEDVAHADSERGCCRDAAGEDATDARQPSRCQEHGHWDTEPNVGRVAHGIPSRTHRLKALGNSIVWPVAYEILKHL
jgi:DNA (cytosine-5)-methyltransferase 1